MPFEKTESKLEDLLAKALNNEEIQDGANRADLKVSVLRKRFLVPNLQAKARKVWEAGAHDIEEYDKWENEYEDHVTQLRREVAQMRRSYLRIPTWALVTILVSLSPIFLLTGLLIFLSVLDQAGLSSSPVTLGSIFNVCFGEKRKEVTSIELVVGIFG